MRAMMALWMSMMLAAGCGSDTTHSVECEAGTLRNPVSGVCETPLASAPDAPTGPGEQDSGENDQPSQTEDACPGCVLRFEPGSIEIEYTPALETNVVTVELVNIGDAAITIERKRWADSTAPELVARGLDTPLELAPLARRQISIEHSPLDRDDDQVTLELFAADSDVPVARLPIATRLIGEDVCTDACPKIVVDPPLVSFSYQPDADPMQAQVAIGSAGTVGLDVLDILLVQQGDEFAVTSDPLPMNLGAGQSTVVDITFDPSTRRVPDAELLIRSTDPWTPEVRVPIRAVSKTSSDGRCMAVSPTTLNYGSLQRGQTLTKSFWIENCGTIDLEVTDIRRGSFIGIQTTQAFQLTSWQSGTIPPGGREQVDVTYAPRRAGQDIGHFTVMSDSEPSSVRVNLRGTATPPPLTDQDIHVEVEWDSDDTDVDLHVLLLPGQGLFCDNDCNFSNPEPDWGVAGDWQDDPFLDVDDVDGYGPENVNIERGIDQMTYRIVLHYWDDTYGESFPDSANATVRLYIRGQLEGEWGPTYLPATGDTWDVFEIDWPSRQVTTFNDPLYRVPSSTSCRSTP